MRWFVFASLWLAACGWTSAAEPSVVPAPAPTEEEAPRVKAPIVASPPLPEWPEPTRLAIPGQVGGLALWIHGDPRTQEPVVIVHGGPGGCSRATAEFLPLLRQMGRSAVFYDQRGAGRSGPMVAWTEITLEAHVADLEAIRQHLGLPTMDVIGHSWGGMLSAAYSEAHPGRVDDLVLVGSGSLDSALSGGWVGVEHKAPMRGIVTSDPDGVQRYFLGGRQVDPGAHDGLFSARRPVQAAWEDRLCFRRIKADFKYYAEYDSDALRHALSFCKCELDSYKPTYRSVGETFDFSAGPGAAKRALLVFGDHDPLREFVPDAVADAPSVELSILAACGHRPHVECPGELAEQLVGLLGPGR